MSRKLSIYWPTIEWQRMFCMMFGWKHFVLSFSWTFIFCKLRKHCRIKCDFHNTWIEEDLLRRWLLKCVLTIFAECYTQKKNKSNKSCSQIRCVENYKSESLFLTRGPQALTVTRISETLHWLLVRRALTTPL